MSPLSIGEIGGTAQRSSEPSTLPAITPQFGRTAKRLKLAQRYLPTNDPYEAALYYNLASSDLDDDSYLDAVATTAGFRKARQYVRMFKRLGSSTTDLEWKLAQSVWDGFSNDQRAVIQAMGVKPPAVRRAQTQTSDGGGLIGGFTDLVGDAWDVVGAPVRVGLKGLGEAGEGALWALNKPKSIIDHIYRVGSISLGGDWQTMALFGVGAAAAIAATVATGGAAAGPLAAAMGSMGVLGTAAAGAAGGLAATSAGAAAVAAFDPAKFNYAWDVAGEGHGERAVHLQNRDRALEILGGDEALLDKAFDVMVSGDPNAVAFEMTEKRAKARGVTRQADPEAYNEILQGSIKMVRSKAFTQAVTTLQAGKVSPGRDLAGLLLAPGDVAIDLPGIGEMNAYQLISGLADATWTIASDPILMAGRFTKAARVAAKAHSVDDIPKEILRTGIWEQAYRKRTATDIIRMAAEPSYRRQAISEMRQLGMNDHEIWASIWVDGLQGADDVERARRFDAASRIFPAQQRFGATLSEADLAKRGVIFSKPRSLDSLAKEFPTYADMLLSGDPQRVRAAVDYLQEVQRTQRVNFPTAAQGLATPEAFRDFMVNAEGYKAIMAGRASAGTAPALIWPGMTWRAERWLDVKIPLEQRIGNWMSEGGWAAHKDAPILFRVRGQAKKMSGRLFNDLTQQTPTRDAFDIMGPKAGTELLRFMARSLPYDRRWEVYGQFMRTATPAGRRHVAYEAMKEVFEAYGLRSTGQADDFVDMWLGAVSGNSRSLAYAVDPQVSKAVVPGGPPDGMPLAIWKSQLADNLMAVPNLREMGKALRKQSAYHRVMGAPNADWISSFMNRLWKPMVLLRIGFIPRAAGEETLAWLAREPMDLAKGWLAYPFHYPIRDFEVSAPLRTMARIERRFRHPEYYDDYMKTYRLRKQAVEAAAAGTPLPDEELAPLADLVRKNTPWVGVAYKQTAIKERPHFLFDPRDIEGTKKLERFVQKMTGWMLDDADLAILRDVLEEDAIIRSYMQAIVGADHYLWPSAAEMFNLRQMREVGVPSLHNQRRVHLFVDPSRYGVRKGGLRAHEDPIINFAIDSAMHASMVDDDLRTAVAALPAFVPASEQEAIFAITGLRVRDVQDAWARTPREIRDEFDFLLRGPSAGATSEEIQAAHAEIARLLHETDGLRPDDVATLARLNNTFDRLNVEQGSAMIADLRGLYSDIVGFKGRTPLVPVEPDDLITNVDDVDDEIRAIREALDDLGRSEVGDPLVEEELRRRLAAAETDRANLAALAGDLPDGPLPPFAVSPAYLRRKELVDAARAGEPGAIDKLLYDISRARLAGPDANLTEFERALFVDGKPLASAPRRDHQRIWFPVARRQAGLDVAARAAQSTEPLSTTLQARLLAAAPDGTNPDAMLPLMHWGHADPRDARALADQLLGDEPYTLGYIDVPIEHLDGYRFGTDPRNEWRYIDPREFAPDRITLASNPDELTRVGPGPDMGVGPSYDDMLDNFARQRVASIKERFIEPGSGRVRYAIARPVGSGRWDPTYLYLDGASIPSDVIGPGLVTARSTLYDDVVRFGFDRVIGPAIDTIVRRPMFLTAMARARRQLMEVSGKRLLPDLGPARAAMARLDFKPDQVDDFYRTVGPTLRWAEDHGVEIKDVNDLLRVLKLRSSDLYTENVRGLTHDVKNAIARLERPDPRVAAELGLPMEPPRNHPLWRMIEDLELEHPDALARRYQQDVIKIGLRDEEVSGLVKWFRSERSAREQITRISAERAFGESVRYIDDHAIRSQFAEHVRNLVPFYFAEEQFLKRWARSMVYDPAGVRRIQLLKHGLDSIGFTKTDPQTGEDYFVYPFSGELNDLLGRTSEILTGEKHRLPVFVPMTGQVRYALPGLDNRGMPQVGPLIATPIKALANRFPELRPLEYEVLGERAAGLPLATQIVPVSIKRFWDAFTASPDKSREMASVMTSVIQIMDAEGLTPAENAPAVEVEQYLDRVENWTRTLMLTRAVLGFVGPASPSGEVPGKEMTVEFRNLLKDLPIGEAIATFLSANPDATAFTVFRSRTPSGAVLPTGKRTFDWLEQNRDLVGAYPLGMPWLIPQEHADDEYEARTYNQQIALGIRERRLPVEMYEEVKFAKAAPMYFDTKDRYDEAIAAAQGSRNPDLVASLREEFGRWKQSYLVQHPVFAEQLASPEGRQRRLDTLEQLQEMKGDDRVLKRMPRPVRETLDAWEEYEAAYDLLRYRTGTAASRVRKNLRVNIYNMLDSYTRRHREARPLFLRLMRPELDLDDQDLANPVPQILQGPPAMAR